MKNSHIQYGTVAAFAVTIPLAARLTVPGTMSLATFAAMAALTIGGAVVILNTLRNGRATGSVGELIYHTETGIAPTPKPNAATPRSGATS